MDDQDRVEELYVDEEVAEEESPAAEQDPDRMEDYEAALTPKEVARGEIVAATVAEVQEQAIIIDMGTKYEGFIPRAEFDKEEDLPALGDQVYVAVVNVDEKNERIRCSKKRADYERVWVELYKAQEAAETLNATVTERVKGGLRVDVGVPGFVPASQVMVKDVRQLDRFVGRILPLKVLEVDRRSNKVVLSHRQAVEEDRQRRREKTLSRLYEGAVCEGRVVSLTDYGAFVDLGGLDGLLHISELAWHHVNHPSDVLKKNDIVRVMVLSIEDGGNRISLSRREILPDPWKELPDKYEMGQTVEAEVTRLVSTGAFARLADIEAEGFIPLREISEQRIRRADDVLSPGQKVEAKIIEMQPTARKLTLSVVQASAQRERQEIQSYLAPAESGSSINLGEQFGDVLLEAKSAIDEEAPAAEEAVEPEAVASPEIEEQAPEAAAEEAPEELGEVAVEEPPTEPPTESPEESPEETAEEAAEEESSEETA